MMMPAITTTTLSRNGIRQPHDWKASGDMAADSGRNTAAARTCPACTPCRVKLPKYARRPNGECSTIIALAPAISPPTAKPWISRRTTSSAGASRPDLVVGGQNATQQRRCADHQHAEDQHVLAAVRIAEVTEDERADGSRHVAHAEQSRTPRLIAICGSPFGKKMSGRPARRPGRR
jgi:hypothetical protein